MCGLRLSPALFPSQGLCQEEGAIVIVVGRAVAGTPCLVDTDRRQGSGTDVHGNVVIGAKFRLPCFQYTI